jgi:sulfur carrier protein ThiS
MRLHLGGHLNYFEPLQRTDLEVEVVGNQPLKDILARLKIPAQEVFLVSINGVIAPIEEALIRPEDYVQLFPPLGGG